MKLTPALTIVCLLLASPALSADKDELQGTWIVESFEKKGRKKDEIKGASIVFSGDTTKIKSVDVEQVGSYKADTDKKPHQLDLLHTLAGKEVTTLAIFKIEGDTLTISSGTTSAIHSEGKTTIEQGPRPTAFDSKVGTLMVLKRMKK